MRKHEGLEGREGSVERSEELLTPGAHGWSLARDGPMRMSFVQASALPQRGSPAEAVYGGGGEGMALSEQSAASPKGTEPLMIPFLTEMKWGDSRRVDARCKVPCSRTIAERHRGHVPPTYLPLTYH